MSDLIATIRKTLFVPIHPAGWPFITAFAVLAVVLTMIDDTLGFVGIVLTAWCVYFFRNPVRQTPARPGLIVSPGDGIVSLITESSLPPELTEFKGQGDPTTDADKVTRVSVFLNVFDVHVNRVPISGDIRKVVYHPGKFLNANLDKASVDNERSTVLVQPEQIPGAKPGSVVFVQIAGLVARRIICRLNAGQKVKAGEVYGIIRFGSRVDVYLPPGVSPLVAVGQRMIGGETVIADLLSSEPARTAENRGG
jgi:phosphatidylserine decarboxylase